jgi:hypothetical protein
MPANIREGSNLPLAISHDDDRLTGDIEYEIVPALGYPTGMADTEPVTQVNARYVALEESGIGVERLLEGKSLGLPRDQIADGCHSQLPRSGTSGGSPRGSEL